MPQIHSAYHTNQYGSMSAPKLILALLDAAVTATTRATIAVEEGDIAKRGESVSRALAIVGELQGCLDMAAGDIADNLFALYDYTQRELLVGNLRGDVGCLENAAKVLTEIHDAWSQMLDVSMASANDDATSGIAEYA